MFTFDDHRETMTNAAPAVATFDDGRKHPRTHLFVAATLYSDVGSAPAHIRNMSRAGALIESSVIPQPGSGVILKRGSLQTAGRIAWKIDRKAGLAFSTSVFVGDWMARQSGSHQDRVDEIVSKFKAGSRHGCPTVEVEHSQDSCSVEAELLRLRAELAQLGGSLIGDTILVATHPEIQTLDIALQRIDRLIDRL